MDKIIFNSYKIRKDQIKHMEVKRMICTSLIIYNSNEHQGNLCKNKFLNLKRHA